MEEGGRPCLDTVEMSAYGHSDVVENAEEAWWSVVMVLQNESVRVLEAFWRTGSVRVLLRIPTVGPGWCRGGV